MKWGALASLLVVAGLVFAPIRVSAADSWSTGASGGTARDDHSAIIYQGKMYVWGGWTGAITNTLYIST